MTTPRICVLIGGDVQERDGLRRIPVAMVARGFKGKQKFAVSREDLAQIVANFRARGTGDLVVDYNHSTEFAAPSGEESPAAGWLKEIEDAPDDKGVLYGWVEFTDRARQAVDAKEYKYVSPVIVWGARSKATGEPQGTTLTSVALTNSPLLEGLPALVCSDGWEIDRGDVVEERREKKTVRVIMAAIAAGTVRLVADDNTESVHSVEGLKVLTMSDVKRDSEGRFDFAALPHDVDVLIASDVVRGMQAQAELDAAVAKTLILPAQRPMYERMAMSDLEGFRALVATMKPQVELGERGLGGDGGEMDELAKVEAQIGVKVSEKLKSNTGLQYHEALKLVASENPELDRRRTTLIRGGGKR